MITQKKYDNIKVFHKESSGIADTRNYGIEKTTSEYIFFLDSDDYISKDCIEFLIKALLDNNCDIAVIDEIQFIDGQLIKRCSNITNNFYILNNIEAAAKSMLLRDLNTSPHRFIAKKSLLKTIPFQKGRVFEDVAIIPKIYFNAKKVFYSKEAKYFYRHRAGSITHPEWFIMKLIQDELLAGEGLVSYFKGKCPSILFSATDLLVNISVDVVRRAKNSKIEKNCKELIDKSWKYIRKYRKQIILNNICNKNTRIKCLLSLLGIDVLSFAVNMYKKFKERY